MERSLSKAVNEFVAGAEDYPNTWDSFRAFNMLLGFEFPLREISVHTADATGGATTTRKIS